jgi:hypothetical protein
MSDRMAAEIWIGGKLPRSLRDEFPISDLRVDWDETRIDASSAEAILAARQDGLLHFCDCEASYGEFQELEGWLREHNIPFQRQSSGKFEYDPYFIEFRPDLPGKKNRDRYTLTTQEGTPVICHGKIEKALQSMARLVKDQKRSETKRLQAWERVYRRLIRSIPSKLPPLPIFEIF